MKQFLIASLVLWSTLLQAGLPPTTLSGQSATLKPTTFTFKTPYNQSTQTNGIESLIETGNENMLVNPGMEGGATSGVALGWTSTAGTASVTSVAGEFTSGKKAQKVVLTAQTLNYSQTVTTPSGIQKQGFIRATYKVPSTVTDFAICALVDAVEQNCLQAAKLILDNLYHTIDLPISFGATSAGVKFKTLTAATGTVFFDASGVFQGLANAGQISVDTSRAQYSPIFTGFGTPSGVSCWNSRNGEYLDMDCYFVSGTTTAVSAAVGLPSGLIASSSLGTLVSRGHYALNSANSFSGEILVGPGDTSVFFGQQAVGATATASKQNANTLLSAGTIVTFNARVPIQGWQSNSSTYSQASANVSALYTGAPATGTLGAAFNTVTFGTKVVDTHSAYSAGTFTTPATGRYSMSWAVSVSGTYNAAQQLQCNIYVNGTSKYQGTNAPTASINRAWVQASVEAAPLNQGDLVTVRCYDDGSGLSFESNAAANYFSINRVDSAFISGLFEGMEKCANQLDCTQDFSAYASATAGVITSSNYSGWISNTAYAGGEWTVTFAAGIFPTTAPACQATLVSSGSAAGMRVYSITNTSAKVVPYVAGATSQTPFYITCSRQGADAVFKTAKIASSIGVPTVPGIVGVATGDRVDTFSVSYGTTNSTTVCSATPCSYIDQIGNAVTNFTRSTAGAYLMTLAKTYVKLKCALTASSATVNMAGLNARNLTCANCSTLDFITKRPATETDIDSFGTLLCMGTY